MAIAWNKWKSLECLEIISPSVLQFGLLGKGKFI